MNRFWGITLEHAKRSVKIDDTLDDETYRMAIQAASDAMPGQFFVQTRMIEATARHHDHVLIREMGLLSVSNLQTREGSTWRTWSSSDYELGPSEAPYLMPPRPYWKISRVHGATHRFPASGYGRYGIFDGPNVRITGKWGTYDLRKRLSVTLVAPDDDDEIQLLTPSGTISGGTFTLTFSGDETAPINWDATAGEIQAALELLPSIGAGNIVGTGGPITTDPVTLTFAGTLANADQPQIAIDDMNLTGAGADLAASTVQEGSAVGDVSDSTTTLTVSATGAVETGHTLHIDDEDLFVESVSGAVLTVERAINGSTAATHAGGAAIEIYTYPSVDQAVLLLVQRYARRTKDAPFGVIGSIDGFMQLAINDPDVLGLVGKFRQQAVA